MEPINRVAIVVAPKEPFGAWARSLEPQSPYDQLSPSNLTSVYLVEADPDDGEEIIARAYFAQLFEEELNGWFRDAGTWPCPRTFEMFQEWFDVRVVDVVLDLGDELIERED